MKSVNISIVGASGYAGGELLRLLLFHPNVKLRQVTSERFAGKSIHKVHPNLRGLSNFKFCSLNELEKCDLLFLCMPHSKTMRMIDFFKEKCERIIDLSGDFRLNDAEEYVRWYGEEHTKAELLKEFIYGIPELHREEMKNAKYVSSAGCNATAVILGIYPLFKEKLALPDRTVVDVKTGSSESGSAGSDSSHHPARQGSLRSFKPTGHRHTAEIQQELNFGERIEIYMSLTSVNIIRGVLATASIFLKEKITEKDIWKLYRKYYSEEPFVRIVKERDGLIRFPDPKILAGTNYCDVGFALDENRKRLVVISAIDNLMKGAAGQAVQAFNIMYGFEETTALGFAGLFPA